MAGKEGEGEGGGEDFIQTTFITRRNGEVCFLTLLPIAFSEVYITITVVSGVLTFQSLAFSSFRHYTKYAIGSFNISLGPETHSKPFFNLIPSE